MILGIAASVCAILLALFPTVSMNAAKDALLLCSGILIPSLFPFFVVANLLIKSGITNKAAKTLEPFSKTLFGVSGKGAAAICMGLISGYPAGAATTCNLYQNGSITKKEAMRLLTFTNNAGPLFIIGTIGTGIYQNNHLGYILFFSCLLAALFTGFFCRFLKIQDDAVACKNERKKDVEPVENALETMLTLCGYVIVFSVFLAFMEKLGVIKILSDCIVLLGVPPQTAHFLVQGFFEISTAASKEGTHAAPIMAFVLSFGGLSVFLQTAGIVRRAGLSMKTYCIGKLMAGILSFCICKCLLAVFPKTINVFAGILPFKIASNTFGFYLYTACILAFGVKKGFSVFGKKTPDCGKYLH